MLAIFNDRYPGYEGEYDYHYENMNMGLCVSPTENISKKMSEYEHECMSLTVNPSKGASIIVIKSISVCV